MTTKQYFQYTIAFTETCTIRHFCITRYAKSLEFQNSA